MSGVQMQRSPGLNSTPVATSQWPCIYLDPWRVPFLAYVAGIQTKLMVPDRLWYRTDCVPSSCHPVTYRPFLKLRQRQSFLEFWGGTVFLDFYLYCIQVTVLLYIVHKRGTPRGRILGRIWGKSLKSFPPCYSQSPLQLCLESISSNWRNLLHISSFNVLCLLFL